jgi:hypothetical protein
LRASFRIVEKHGANVGFGERLEPLERLSCKAEQLRQLFYSGERENAPLLNKLGDWRCGWAKIA